MEDNLTMVEDFSGDFMERNTLPLQNAIHERVFI